MFHAAGWTFPWSCTFSIATQVGHFSSFLYHLTHLIDYSSGRRQRSYLEKPGCNYALLCCSNSVGPESIRFATYGWIIYMFRLIGLVNHGKAYKVSHSIKAAIAGAAPTAHLLEELEKINIAPVHVYGLTEVCALQLAVTFCSKLQSRPMVHLLAATPKLPGLRSHQVNVPNFMHAKGTHSSLPIMFALSTVT